MPVVPSASLGCAICDPMIAAWCCAGAPSVYGLVVTQTRTPYSGRGRTLALRSGQDEALDTFLLDNPAS